MKINVLPGSTRGLFLAAVRVARWVSRLMNGHKVAPSAETLEALGLRAVPLYEVLKRPNVAANRTAPCAGPG